MAERGGEHYDVAVIGAGVVGCAVARRFALAGARVVVLEKAVDVLDGASKGNSGILHTGFDAPPGSLEQACVAAGHAEYLAIRERLGLPLLPTGALVLAWTDEEAARLPQLMDQARENGVDDVAWLDGAAIRALEPEISDAVRCGFRVPREYLVDPWSAAHAYLLQAVENGAELRRAAPVTGGTFDGGTWTLATPSGSVRAGAVVNCAGLFGDQLDASLLGESDFSIRPRKGQFVVFDKAASRLLTAILLPVPTATTKGVVVCRTSYGNVLVGPTAEEQESRTDASTDTAALRDLRARGIEILPGLAGFEVTAAYAGLRPATEEKDYRIRDHPARRYVSVGGIRSTGLSGALGIAHHVLALYAGFAAAHEAPREIAWPRLRPIAEGETRDWACPGNGGVVCHCELVTRREIDEALSGPLAVASMAGLKRRTRATMGRCQGFYCMGELAEITAGRFAEPLAVGDADGR